MEPKGGCVLGVRIEVLSLVREHRRQAGISSAVLAGRGEPLLRAAVIV